jgi:hypothetical protein
LHHEEKRKMNRPRGPYKRRRKPAQFEDPKTFVLNYELGLLTKGEIVYGFQRLIDLGIVWTFEHGCYARKAEQLIKEKSCTSKRQQQKGGNTHRLTAVEVFYANQGG